jgi:Na+/proline symporter
VTITPLDWTIVAAYFLFCTAIGLFFTKRGGKSLDEYFLSGRQVPWWLAGTAMVATTFAADTPLVVAALVATKGVAGNWLWWNFVMSGMLTVFFFARLWRRAEVMTDAELAEVRYGGRPAAFLRGFRALYLAVPINLIILGWVTRAMIKILTIALGLRDLTIAGMTVSGEVVAVGICFAITAVYAVAAGMWAVLWTDLVQFVIKMSAVIVLAVYAVRAVGGIDVMKIKLVQHFGSETAALSVLPVSATASGLHAYAWMPLLTLGVYLSVQWWAAWYPGAEPGGGGYVAQRIFSARTEKDGVLATLFFQIAHYALRPWPWIVTGLATVILYPGLQDREAGYVQAFVDLLPTPWRGFMLAGFAAAYMSTVATHLNWGASYLVNDFYKRFVRRDASQAHYVAVSRAATILLFLASIAVTSQLSSVEKAWELLLALGAGTGLVLILRWYWWRINAWSEISAMVASFAVSLLGFAFIKPRFAANDPTRRRPSCWSPSPAARRVAGRDAPHPPSPTPSSTPSTGACAPAAPDGRRSLPGSGSGARRSPVGRSPGPTGSPASWPSTQRSSASGRSFSASPARGWQCWPWPRPRSTGSRARSRIPLDIHSIVP